MRLKTISGLLVLSAAGCGPRQTDVAPAPYEAKPVLSPPSPAPGQGPGGVEPVVKIVRTGLEFQPHRGAQVGDAFLGGRLVAQRVTDASSLGVLHGAVQLQSKSHDPVFASYRFLFYDDKNEPVGPVFSLWTPFAVSEPFGTVTLAAASSARSAVYFAIEVKP